MDDTAERRPARDRFDPEFPTDPLLVKVPPPFRSAPQGGPVAPPDLRGEVPPPRRPPILAPRFVLEHDQDTLARFLMWVTLLREGVFIVALFGVLWLVGLAISRGGVPVWLVKGTG
jgi:hypothetical protein